MHCGNKKNIFWLRVLFFPLLLTGCKTDYQNLPAFSAQKQLQVVILTPAGSNHPQTYNGERKEFTPALVAGQPVKINFLPFPGNMGFIPSTAYQSADSAAEGQPLAALVLSESQPTGTVQEVIPIACVLLEVAGEKTPVVIAVPARPSEQIIAATDFAEFSQKYPAAKDFIQKWFTFYKPPQKVRFIYWKDEKETDKLIQRWLR